MFRTLDIIKSMTHSVNIFPSVSVCVLVTQLCLTLYDHMDYNTTGSSVHGILQARVTGGLPFPSPGHLHDSGIKSESPTLQSDSLPSEPLGKPSVYTCSQFPLVAHFQSNFKVYILCSQVFILSKM